MFIVVEGPNGVGKSAVADALARLLRARGLEVLQTREPSDSALGVNIRALEGDLLGHELAHACAADRLHHVRTTIAPARQLGTWVICDRYVPSSLVLQRMDGLTLDEIWAMNCRAATPDVVVYLEETAETIGARLADRSDESRLERQGNPGLELDYYRDARTYLAGHGWKQLVVVGTGRSPESLAEDLAEQLDSR